MALVYISIGSNLDGPAARVRQGIARLRTIGTLVAVSSLYRTKPWGPVRDQPDFVNAVAAIETARPPQDVLGALQTLERELGRTAGQRFGPRTIDLDLLLYDELELHEPGLVIPHRHLRERAFVLVPLAEIDERYVTWRDALPDAELTSVKKLEAEAS
jgi:2-amino-4-hydroxy-6-hydroxymethyldihydropteridine diphosphokinase